MYDVFISYSFVNKQTADAICHYFESSGLRCWYAPRDVRPGMDYRAEIMSAIEHCKCLLLVYTKESNDSPDVLNEVTAAFKAKIPILPFRVENVEMRPALAYYLNGVHWLDALIPPIENSIHILYQTVCAIVGNCIYSDEFDNKQNPAPQYSTSPTVNLLLPAIAIVAIALVLALVLPILGRIKPDSNANLVQQLEEDTNQYPRTEEQIIVTQSLVANVGYNLSYINELAKVHQDVLDASKKYLLTGEASQKVSCFQQAENALNNLNIDKGRPSAILMLRMQRSPFSLEELYAMHDMVLSFRDETAQTLEYMQFITGEECMLSQTEKLRTVELYQDYLEQTLLCYAYCTNEMLLPVNQEQYLETFWNEMLPYMGQVPLNQKNWSRDKQALVSAENECYENLEDILMELSGILGNFNVALQQDKADQLQQLLEAGYSRERSNKIVDYMSRDWEAELSSEGAQQMQQELEAMLTWSVLKTDSLEIIWEKMTHLLDLDMYEEVDEAIIFYQMLMNNAGGSNRYVPALILYSELKKQGQLDFGIMVMEYYEPDGINQQLMIGDILYSFNGEACRTVADYLAMKDALTEDSYVVKVIRLDENNAIQQLELTLKVDSPRVYINDLTPTE